MSNRKFASITGSLLVRKGEALPSPASQRRAAPGFAREAWPAAEPDLPAPPPHAGETGAPRRLTFRLDNDRYRRLCIASAQMRSPVQHLLTAALDRYLAALCENELAGCSCMREKSGCARAAAHAEMRDNLPEIRRPT